MFTFSAPPAFALFNLGLHFLAHQLIYCWNGDPLIFEQGPNPLVRVGENCFDLDVHVIVHIRETIFFQFDKRISRRKSPQFQRRSFPMRDVLAGVILYIIRAFLDSYGMYADIFMEGINNVLVSKIGQVPDIVIIDFKPKINQHIEGFGAPRFPRHPCRQGFDMFCWITERNLIFALTNMCDEGPPHYRLKPWWHHSVSPP